MKKMVQATPAERKSARIYTRRSLARRATVSGRKVGLVLGVFSDKNLEMKQLYVIQVDFSVFATRRKQGGKDNAVFIQR
jgi:hypothetical protein